MALFLARSARAQFASLDNLGEHFAKQLKPLKPKLIAIADLTPLEGALPSQGHYFASFLTLSIRHHGKKKLPVSDHAEFDEALTKANLSPASLASPDAIRTVAGKVKPDLVIIGSIGRNEQDYTFNVTAVRVSNGEIVFSGSAAFHRTEFVDSFSEPFPPKFDQPVFTTTVKDSKISIPSCINCPPPQYNEFARRDRIQGTCLFSVLISPEGHAVALHLVRLIGYGLDEQAFNIIKTWKFKPAIKDGTPVYAIVPIELTFRLF